MKIKSLIALFLCVLTVLTAIPFAVSAEESVSFCGNAFALPAAGKYTGGNNEKITFTGLSEPSSVATWYVQTTDGGKTVLTLKSYNSVLESPSVFDFEFAGDAEICISSIARLYGGIRVGGNAVLYSAGNYLSASGHVLEAVGNITCSNLNMGLNPFAEKDCGIYSEKGNISFSGTVSIDAHVDSGDFELIRAEKGSVSVASNSTLRAFVSSYRADNGLAIYAGNKLSVESGATLGIAVGAVNTMKKSDWEQDGFLVSGIGIHAVNGTVLAANANLSLLAETRVSDTPFTYPDGYCFLVGSCTDLYGCAVWDGKEAVCGSDSKITAVVGAGSLLPSPTGLSWSNDGKSCSWNAVADAMYYDLIIYRNGSEIFEYYVSGTSFAADSLVVGKGEYSFSVTSIGSSSAISPSAFSGIFTKKATGKVIVSGVDVYGGEKVVTYWKAGTAAGSLVSANSSDYTVMYDGAGTLTLRNASLGVISVYSEEAHYPSVIGFDDDLVIELSGKNTVTFPGVVTEEGISDDGFAVYAANDSTLHIVGASDASLVIDCGLRGAISAENIVIENADITVNNSKGFALSGNSSVSVTGSSLDLTCNEGILCSGTVSLGSTTLKSVTDGCCISTYLGITVSGCTLDVTTAESLQYTAFYSETGRTKNDTGIVISDTAGKITGDWAALGSYSGVEISGSELTLIGRTSCGIYCYYGDLVIDDCVLTATGGSSYPQGLYVYDGKMIFSGAKTVIDSTDIAVEYPMRSGDVETENKIIFKNGLGIVIPAEYDLAFSDIFTCLSGSRSYACGITENGGELEYNPGNDRNSDWQLDGTAGQVKISLVSLLGDVNGDGSINVTDYVMAKRAVLGTYTLSEEQKARADVNGDGSINTTDYLMIKRHVLGTYIIK